MYSWLIVVTVSFAVVEFALSLYIFELLLTPIINIYALLFYLRIFISYGMCINVL